MEYIPTLTRTKSPKCRYIFHTWSKSWSMGVWAGSKQALKTMGFPKSRAFIIFEQRWNHSESCDHRSTISHGCSTSIAGWWLRHPSGKYEFVKWDFLKFPTEWQNRSHVPVATNQILTSWFITPITMVTTYLDI